MSNNDIAHGSPTRHNATVCLWNAGSIRNRTATLSDYLIEHDVDLIRITESWLKINDAVVIRVCTLPSYSFLIFQEIQMTMDVLP